MHSYQSLSTETKGLVKEYTSLLGAENASEKRKELRLQIKANYSKILEFNKAIAVK